MKRTPHLSILAREALRLLATQLETARRERGMTQAELAERVGVSVNTLKAALQGSPRVAVGTVLEVAAVLGVPLFSDEGKERSIAALRRERTLLESLLGLLPRRVHRTGASIDDNF